MFNISCLRAVLENTLSLVSIIPLLMCEIMSFSHGNSPLEIENSVVGVEGKARRRETVVRETLPPWEKESCTFCSVNICGMSSVCQAHEWK